MIEEACSTVSDLNWLLERAKPSGLLADSELVANKSSAVGMHEEVCELSYSVLQHSFQEWRAYIEFLPVQLVGRLLPCEAMNSDVAQFLAHVRNWAGPSQQGWWCPVSQTLPPADGTQLNLFTLPFL